MPASCQMVQTRTVGPAPEIVAPRAPSSARRVDQLHRARVEVARRGYGGGPQAASDQSRSSRCRPGRAARRRDVDDGVGQRHLGGIAARAPRSRPPRPGSRHALEPGGRVEAGCRRRASAPSAQTTKPPGSRRRRCRDGPPARSPGPADRPRDSASSKRWSAANSPATIAAALEPSPRASGISVRIRKASPSAGCRLSKARTNRLSRPVGDIKPTGIEHEVARSSTSNSRCKDERRRHHVVPRAEVGRGGGARTSRWRAVISNTARSTALRSFSQLMTAGALPRARCRGP